ncbi:GNAT family N-acetyltransferase [Oceanobacillus alkalisoli]|uniref:GNAT family N-acetyltransferase n=1 Tax=Oceanobacillus alkalisoli TaxID=2925113 RepID=UPI001EF0B274|nr:GNAT family N-acetyltransferase [Oceanobacillus alkalisoli]MCF3943678.1 GNAT family N-acetyltransferase [Oceanobacillus alkalisoli]MCG5104091.1 GNAT family N-acetyltransferase [Oceanobacillus alkalisoli]
MKKIVLAPHDKKYAKTISSLSQAPQVRESLGLNNDQTSIDGTIQFIEFVQENERLGKQYSRVILNENDELIGVITLKEIDNVKKTCHIGTWIGHPYWGKGYNELAKEAILYTAFTELNMEYVFAGAKLTNIRSQKAQEKLPYVKIDVRSEFPDEYKKLEKQVDDLCLLNVIEKATFLDWYLKK